MDLSGQVLIAVIAFLALVFFLRRNQRLPPGPWRLPVIGSTIQLYLANSKIPYLALSKIGEKYGEIFSFGFGSKLAVTVSSYEGMQDIFKLNEANIKRHDMPFVEDRNFGKNLGIIFTFGQKWIDTRAITKKLLREYGYGKVKIMEKSLNESAIQLVDDLKSSLLDSCDETLPVKSSTFSVHVLNILWSIVGGYKFDPNDGPLNQTMKCLGKAVAVYGNNNIYNTIPFLKTWFPKLVNYPEHLKIHEEIHGFSKFLIDNAIERRSERLDADPTSVIEAFLDKIEDDQGNSNSMFTMEELQIILEDLLLGGLETTGNLLSWAILLLAVNPDKQNKVRQMVFDKVVDRDSLSATELKQIPYMKATILEVMRIGNVVPINVPRLATAEIKFKDYIIPEGTLLLYNLYTLYNDKAFWKDPETFRPERYLNENGDIDQLTSERILNTVFGVGGRVCFGEAIGLDSLYTYFAALIANFRFESIPGQEPAVENRHFTIANCPDDFIVKVKKLST